MSKTFSKYLNRVFGNITAGDIARKNLNEYQAAYLKHQCDAAWNLKMAEFYREGIERMREFHPVEIPLQLKEPG